MGRPKAVMLRRVLGAALVALAFLHAVPAAAQSLIRDAEIERTLRRIADPILRAAGLNPARVNIYIVNSRDLNAFVAGGDNIFVHTGLLTRLDTIDQVRAVLAHEVGHITGGHLTRRDQALRGARGVQALGMLGALAATAAGSPEAGVAIAAGTQQAALRNALAHSRGEESNADQAAVRYMAAAGTDPGAMLEVLKLFRGQEALMSYRMDSYARTHPLWAERLTQLESRIAEMPSGRPPSDSDVYWHRRMVAKFDAFLLNPSETLKRYPASDTSETAALSRAIAYHRMPDVRRSIASVDALIAARPDDPYYHELKGQFLLESGRAEAAAASYRRAASLAPDEPLILAGLGRSLLNMNDPAALGEARDVLTRSAARDGDNSGVWRDLALAQARLGNEGQAALATAEGQALEGRYRDALRSAERAAALLPTGSPGWRQAQDVITVARRALN
jgi:predicted Zn-dependent protease